MTAGWLLFLILPAGAGLATRLVFPPISRLLAGGGANCRNYRGLILPTAGGLALLWGATAGLAPLALQGFSAGDFALILAWWGAALAGLADDLLEKGRSKGLKGHLLKLKRGQLTAGAWKAISIFGLSLLASLAWSEPVLLLPNALLGALSANALNLLDLRPGRAIKAYLLGCLVLVTAGLGSRPSLQLLLLAGAALAFLPWELKEEAMLGDTGSNLLGLNLGLAAGRLLPPLGVAGFLAILVLLHWYAERASLGRAIERNRLISLLDRWGSKGSREMAGKGELE